ncbi:MAG TPA: glycosyltransferase family 2 protein [Gaiellaceae bacterium]|jgi:GT2 family glycosyltransferase|nr:glycosyltransferase family 2 protein [Gaiellaceae bacterium]
MAEPAVAVVVVTYDALPWLEPCLASVARYETVVVDHGSTDGTLDLVRERFPRASVLERENRGLAAGWNAGIAATSSRYVLLLNADAWARRDAVERLVRFADDRPRAAVVAPRLRNLDGSLQRSVRGFPTLWRLATEYLFLRKLAPRSALLNGFYAGGFAHDEPRPIEWAMGAVLLVRRAAVEEVGPADESFFLFSEETDWCYRLAAAGWKVWFDPDAEFEHVGAAAHGGRLYVENLRGQLRFLAKHRGPREAERARRLLLAGTRLRALVFPRERAVGYREAARWLASGNARALLDAPR